jgi:hypothetical protein
MTALVFALGFLYIGAKLMLLSWNTTVSARKKGQITKVDLT